MYLHAKQIIRGFLILFRSKLNNSLHGYICDFMIVTVIAFSFLKHAGNSYLNKLHKTCIYQIVSFDVHIHNLMFVFILKFVFSKWFG